jgi:hypothetical protein
MKIIYKPFINQDVVLNTVTDDLEGNVTLQGVIGSRAASLTLTHLEATFLVQELTRLGLVAAADSSDPFSFKPKTRGASRG